jgi:sterol desaturase/sphingolipid hydroxylase (fatty acid hydroxylase superfamily)
VPFLWRFHVAHHADLDLSATTALRFHFGELALSVPWRALQVLAIGVNARELKLWQQATILSILFHHSNLRLPGALERAIAMLMMTPRLHGIHHSARQDETDSNWSSGSTLWDRLHGTLKTDVPQRALTIGVPAYRDPAELTLGNALALPFRPQRDTWRWRPRAADIAIQGVPNPGR